MRPRFGVIAALLVFTGCSSGVGDVGVDSSSASTSATTPATTPATTAGAGDPDIVGVRVVARHPHDTDAFTEGLAFGDDGRLFESTGRYGRSTVREVDPDTGRVIRLASLDPGYFGEGLTLAAGSLVQLTWREGRVLRWDPADLTSRPGGSLDTEGWGLATMPDGTLVSSDGSATLSFRSPDDFSVLRRVEVRRDGTPVDQLNELEVVDGVIWANVWRRTDILRIDPSSGRVTAAVDLGALVPDGITDPEGVLNGIAHRPGDPPTRLWVTGKLWPTLYEIDLTGSVGAR